MGDTATKTLLTRSDKKSVMLVQQPSTAQIDFYLIGEGFTNLSESKNPKEYTRHYIHEKSERSDVTGYAPSLSYSCDAVKGDPVVDDIMYITDHELIGDKTHRIIVTYYPNEGSADARPGYARVYAVVPDASQDGVDALIYTGTFKAVGDRIHGTYNETKKQFVYKDKSNADVAITSSNGATINYDSVGEDITLDSTGDELDNNGDGNGSDGNGSDGTE